jgi:uncharacterized protein YqeY
VVGRAPGRRGRQQARARRSARFLFCTRAERKDIMGLKERITEDMKAAMRAREADRLGAIRMLLAAIKQKEVDERIETDDAAVVAIVERLIKQRKDSIEQFGKAGRTDLVDKETAELKLLQGYLPQALSEAEVAAAIDAAIAEAIAGGAPTVSGADGRTGLAPSAMGKVMALLKPRLAGRADMSKVSSLVKGRIAS